MNETGRINAPKASLDTLTMSRYWAQAAYLTLGNLREMFALKSLPRNIAAGLTVTLVAVPLNLALAIACGLPASTGLVSGAVSGALVVFLGGSRFQVTGPEIALAPITLEIVGRHGLPGLIAATFLAGMLQIALGLFRVGGLVHAIPVPVVGGFLAAVGLLVFDAQLPRLFGLPSELRLLSRMEDLSVLKQIDWTVFFVGIAVIAVMVLLPRKLPKVPAPLAGIVLAVGLAFWIGPSLAKVTPVSGSLPSFGLPALASINWPAIFPEAVALALLASIDSLLCAVSVDGMTGGERTRTDQELVAQGIANMASACCGGMPVAAAVVRSVAAVEAGATTRLAPLVQAGLLCATLLFLGDLLSFVPLVGLAAILLVVGFRLVRFRELFAMWKMARREAAIFVITAASIAMTDFVVGVATGVVLALAHFAQQQRALLGTRAPTAPVLDVVDQSVQSDAITRVIRLEGPLFFASQTSVEDVLRSEEPPMRVVVDVSLVSMVDVSGATALVQALRGLARRGTQVSVISSRTLEPVLEWVRQSVATPSEGSGA